MDGSSGRGLLLDLLLPKCFLSDDPEVLPFAPLLVLRLWKEAPTPPNFDGVDRSRALLPYDLLLGGGGGGGKSSRAEDFAGEVL